MSEELEIKEFDKKELAKQMQEDALKGPHTELRIIVGEDQLNPICSLENKGSTYKEIAVLYSTLGEVQKMIKEKYPLAVLYAHEALKIDGKTEIDMSK